MENTITNRVSESALTTIDLEDFYPKEEVAVFDLKDHLFMGLILKEKDFRATLQTYDWQQYSNKNVGITCSADAIVPMWAYMLVAAYLQPVAKAVVFASENEVAEKLLLERIARLNGDAYTDKRVVVKGCGDVAIGEAAYVAITQLLRGYAKSIMYGEPCSTVPIFKKR